MKVVLTVDSAVSFDFRELEKRDRKCYQKLRKAFTYRNPDYAKQLRLGFSTDGIPQRIKSYRKHKSTISFSRGGLHKVRKILRQRGHTVQVEDHRLSFPPVSFPSKIKLRPEQVEPVAAMLKKHQGIVRGPCSVGKTVLLLQGVAEAKQPALVIVWDTNHQKQWIKAATDPKLLNLKPHQIGGVGGVFKKPKFGLLNICMQQSLWRESNRDFFVDRVGFIGADECQRFGARTFSEVVNAFPAKYRIGVSANERRKDGKEFMIYDAFGKIINVIPDTAIGSRMKSKIFLVPTQFESDAYEWSPNWTQLLQDLANDKARNKLLLKLVQRSVDKGKVCLILTERRAHALYLKFKLKHLRTGLLIGKIAGKAIRDADWPQAWKDYMHQYDADKEFHRVVKLGEQRKLDVIIATQKGDVGLSIKALDHLFITTPTGANTERFNQQKGRVERWHEGKAIPRVFYLWDVKLDRLREAGNTVMKTFSDCSILRVKQKRKVS